MLHALGAKTVKQKAREGDREAQYSQGNFLLGEATVEDAGNTRDAAGKYPTMTTQAVREFCSTPQAELAYQTGKSPKAEVGLGSCAHTAHRFRALT